MGLSFKDSLTNNAKNVAAVNKQTEINDTSLETVTVAAYSLNDVAVFANENTSSTEGWVKATNVKYRYYNNEYNDTDYSTVDAEKNIVLDPKQFNITQEQNSQYIPFQMPRYYDGFDLTKTSISIYYVNKNNDAHSDVPVDVYYNNEYIRFAWLVSEFATKVDGVLQFEIHAKGTNNKGENYTWKSKSIDKLNVLQSLESITTGEIGVSQEELETWYNKIQFETQKASEYAADAKASANEAAKLVAELENGIASEVSTAVNNTVGTLIDEKTNAKLENYYTKTQTYTKEEVNNKIDTLKTETNTHIDQEINKIDLTDVIGLYALKSDVNTALASQNPQNFATEEEVTAAIEAQDISGKLGDYYKKTETYSNSEIDAKLANVNVDLSSYPTKEEVNALISSQDISGKLGDYYKKTETYSSTQIDEKLANVTPNMDGYATEEYVNTKTNTLNASIKANETNIANNAKSITDMGTLIGNLQDEVGAIDKSPRLTYTAVYNDPSDPNYEENRFILYQIENEGKENEVKEPKAQFTITGGSGSGGGSSSKLYINYDKDENEKNITSYVFTVENRENGETTIYFDFSGEDSTGDIIPYANATWKIRKGTSGAWTTIKTETVYPGTHIAFNVDKKYVSSIGSYSLKLETSEDSGGFATKTWSVQIIDVKIESDFSDNTAYPMGTVSFNYTPYGSISKKVHFILDGNEIDTVTTTYSGVPMAYEIPAQTHGSHLLEVYMTATINDTVIESNHIVNDIIWYNSSSSVPIIGTTYQEFTARQYDATNIEYTVYDPSTETPTVEIAVDGDIVSTPTLTDGSTATYTYKTDVAGVHTITITCGKTVKTLKATIVELDIDVAPITAGLVFDFNPSGKSNNDADKIWSNNTVSMSVSDNFDWVNGGYQYDENGDQYFCIKSGTSATIDYNLFGDDAKKNGKEFKLIFKTTNVARPDATFLSCVDNTTGSDNIGIQMDVHEANIYGKVGTLNLPYSEEDIIEFEFNISKNTETIPMVMAYEDGVSTRPMVYGDSHDFTQNTPKIISLGSEYCDLHIYRFKVYNTSLTDSNILNNFIADARNAEEMINRYERNQIYDENAQLDPEILAEKCPWLRVYKVSAPYFTNNKKDKVPNTTIQQIYVDGDSVLDNWTCYNCQHSGQGTSSNNYGQAGRNLDFIMNKSGIDGVKPYFILGDGSEAKKITLSRTSVPTNYLNAKVNIASSNNMTNAMLANRYNEYEPYKRPFIRTAKLTDAYSDEEILAMLKEEQASALAKLQEKVDEEISYIKDTMEFYNCVIFIQETNEDVSTHREFADNDWHKIA